MTLPRPLTIFEATFILLGIGIVIVVAAILVNYYHRLLRSLRPSRTSFNGEPIRNSENLMMAPIIQVPLIVTPSVSRDNGDAMYVLRSLVEPRLTDEEVMEIAVMEAFGPPSVMLDMNSQSHNNPRNEAPHPRKTLMQRILEDDVVNSKDRT